MRKILLATVLLFSTFLQAQLNINNTTLTPAQLVQNVLLGAGVVPTNIKFNGSTANALITRDQAAHFTSSVIPNGLGMNQGILLTTGNAQGALGPNNSGSKTQASLTPQMGDTDLALLSGMTITSAATLEFDFIATGSELNFDYVFGSDEYPEYAPSSFNDVFGFFLSGPGITGPYLGGTGKNIALLPTTTTGNYGVTINNVNQTTNTSYYVSNGTGTNPLVNTLIQYDGYTVPLQATSQLQCGATYHIKIAVSNAADNAFDSGIFLQAGSFSIAQQECVNKIQMVAFIDANNNGIKDSNEINFNNGSFVYQQNNVGDIYNVSSPFGICNIFDSNPLNTYDLNFQIDPAYVNYYAVSATNYNEINLPEGSGTQIKYFPVTITQTFNDVTVDIVPVSSSIPGSNYTNKIVYKNLGTAPVSGTLNFTKSPSATITSVNRTGITNTATGFTYNFTNLAPSQTQTIDVIMSIPAAPTVNINDILTTSATITAPANDIYLSNNTFSNSQIVSASNSANNKMEAKGNKILFSSYNPGDYLTYTIWFQNTGTVNAPNLRIEDLLDAKLDAQSIQMVSASHNYVMERVNNKIIWKFDYINLIGAAQSEQLSKGYVTFKIKLLPGIAVGDIVTNHTEFYFGSNPAIVSNTFSTEFVATLKTVTFNAENILIYPNPASEVINIRLENTMENLESVALYDVLGKSVLKTKNIDSNQSAINVSALSKGVYLVEITTANQLKMTKKLIVK